MKDFMAYTGELRIGAVYQSNDFPSLSRRITAIRRGNVGYVLINKRDRRRSFCELTEEQFREFTSREIPPEEL